MKIGFTLGKYAPLHKGHEHVIATALAEMDHVIAVIYNASQVTDIPTHIRAGWLKQLFPTLEVLIAEDGPQETGYTQDIIDRQNAYLGRLLRDRPIHSFYSSEPYGDSVSAYFGCRNRIVDLTRAAYPISATMIRHHAFDRALVSDVVYHAIKPRVYFLGAPSTGKTTIAQLCAQQSGNAYCKEFGRDYWFEHQQDHRLSMEDLETIAQEQTILEDSSACGNEACVFIDTTTITTLAYAYYYFDRASEKLVTIVRDNSYKYKNVFLCAEDIPFDDTWDRSGPQSRGVIQQLNRQLLDVFQIPYRELSGDPPTRLETVMSMMKEYKPCGAH